jgi:hypothetical protein
MTSETAELFYHIKTPEDNWTNAKGMLVGKYNSIDDLKSNASEETEYIVPLHTFFSEESHSSLPIFLSQGTWDLELKIRNFSELVNYDGDIPTIGSEFVSPKITLVTEMAIINNRVKSMFRNTLQRKELKYLIEYPIVITSDKDSFDLQLAYPTKEIFVLCREKSSKENNDYFNYSQFGTGKSLINSIKFKIDSNTYTAGEKELRLYNNMKKYHNTNRYIYTLPFFEVAQRSSGNFPFDTNKNTSVTINKVDTNSDIDTIVIANSHNVLDFFIKDGKVFVEKVFNA